jgi:hypothetical protein
MILSRVLLTATHCKAWWNRTKRSASFRCQGSDALLAELRMIIPQP